MKLRYFIILLKAYDMIVYTLFDGDDNYIGTYTHLDLAIASASLYYDTPCMYYCDKIASVSLVSCELDKRSSILISPSPDMVHGVVICSAELNEPQFEFNTD